MRTTIIMAIISISLALTSCAKENQKVVSSGPCLGNVCLGVEEQKISMCSENVSNSAAVTIKTCSLNESVSIAGVKSNSSEAMVINGKLARAKFSFDKSSCELVFSALKEKLGEPKYPYGANEYENLYRKFGYSSPHSMIDSGEGWKSEKGFFFQTGAGILGMGQPCTLQIDSDWAEEELKKAIKNPSETSISG